ncbi:MAG: TetR/AcrR family transcriptional regulator [Anaerolineales bacterium]|jgi:AcrR family transcriptional regulator
MKKSEQSSRTREALLESAEFLFAQSGYDATSVASICEASGLSKGAFYHHFESKQALFFELLKRWLNTLEQRLREIESQGDRVPETLMSMAHVVGEVLDVGGPQLSIYLEFWNQALRDSKIHNALSEPFEEFLAFFSSLLTQGVEQGIIESTDPEQTARVITALGIGLLFQGLLNPEAADWNEVSAYGLGIVLAGLSKEK